MISEKMTLERFTEILKEYGITDDRVIRFWNTKPTDNLNEGSLRVACEEQKILDEQKRRSQRQ